MARVAGIPKDQAIFVDASGWKTVVKHPYGHQTDFKGEPPLHKRDENGKVNFISVYSNNINQNKNLLFFGYILSKFNRL